MSEDSRMQQGQRPGRPGAMTMAMQSVQLRPTGPKVLRIDLIQDRRIVEERIIRKREDVYVGASERNHFIIASSDLPARHPLFALVGQDYVLNFTSSMHGKVALPGGVQDLEQLRRSGGARDAGKYHQIKLAESSRGKIKIGDVTLLFQFVTPPPPQPKPQLPAAARGAFVKSIDWNFTAFVVFAYILFFGGILYLESYDYPIEERSIEEELRRVEALYVPPEEPETAEPVETDEQGAEEESTEEVATAKPDKKPAGESSGAEAAPDSGGVSAETQARIVEEAASRAEAMIIGALSNSGGFADVLAGGAVTGDAESVLAQAAGVGVASGGSAGALRTRSGGGSGVSGGL
ncbi:MAG: hypothetical protein ACPGUV_13290, partial [Polyangiales bacterium]